MTEPCPIEKLLDQMERGGINGCESCTKIARATIAALKEIVAEAELIERGQQDKGPYNHMHYPCCDCTLAAGNMIARAGRALRMEE